MTSAADDRRRSQRTSMPALATITTVEGVLTNDQAFSCAMDVSLHGVRLRTGQPPSVGIGVQMRFAIGEHIYCIDGVTRRVVEAGPGNGFDIGIEWDKSDPSKLDFLQDFIARQNRRVWSPDRAKTKRVRKSRSVG